MGCAIRNSVAAHLGKRIKLTKACIIAGTQRLALKSRASMRLAGHLSHRTTMTNTPECMCAQQSCPMIQGVRLPCIVICIPITEHAMTDAL